jgi:predicted transcriptional regulator
LIPKTALDCEDAVQKAHLSVYLEPDMMAQLAVFADRKQQTMSLIAEAAITSYLTLDDLDRREVTRRLDRLTRQGDRLQRDLWIAAETLALFVRFWLTVTPPLPERAQAAAQAKGRERFALFLETLGRRLAKGQSVLREMTRDGEVDGANPRAQQITSDSQPSSQGGQP